MPEYKFTPEGKVLLPMDDGKEQEFIFTEELVPKFTLKDPLVMNNGRKVTSVEEWYQRRKELIMLFEENVFGKTPLIPFEVSSDILEEWSPAFDGTARRKQVKMTITTEYGSHSADMLIYAPSSDEPAPAFMGLNFDGNQSIEPDPKIILPTTWMRDNPGKGIIANQATEMSRGVSDTRWPVKMLLKEGFALVTLYYGDFDPDYDDDFENGLHAIFSPPGEVRNGNNWGAVSAWAFGLSRALDLLENEPAIDAAKVTVIGHSRLGKTSLWAGAQDERFFAVIDNESGCGGSALNKRGFGENVLAINTRFPHWFCKNYHSYNNNETAIPMDTHGLLALIAPRPLYVASAAEDLWADPKGMYLAQKESKPVYEFLGKRGLPLVEFPEMSETNLTGQQAYHVRPGKHDLTLFDWTQYVRFIKLHLGES
ncbi:MAG: acetylxylan esterase [Anaerolineae bacterium]|jgi:hypothetical protein|nr:acetylxylan esterase [Anaerolineae bacterium]